MSQGYSYRLLLGGAALALLAALIPAGSLLASPAGQADPCPATSGNSYQSGAVYQYDLDNPVRPAWNHADKNLALRSYSLTDASRDFVVYGSDDPVQPPQFATLFNPDRTPVFSAVYRANHWNWATSPNPGTQAGPITSPPVTVLGLQTTPGEPLQSPTHGRNLGSPFGTGGAIVIFADADSITLKFTREDSAATGYTMHIDNICVDPNLLALYNTRDNAARNTFYSSTRDNQTDYNLPGLTAGQVFGTARGTEIRVAIVDTGTFQDPRSRDEWWQVRPAPPAIDAPILVSPGSGTDADNPITFSWNPVEGAASYRIRVDDSANFGSPAVNTSVTDTRFTAAGLAAGRLYYWKVQAVNGAGAKSAWSTVWTVQINPAPPPTLIAPDEGAVTGSQPVFTWEPLAGAEKYQIRISTRPDFSSTASKAKIEATSYQPSSPLAGGRLYYWRVRARDTSGVWGEWSETRTFSVP